MAKRRPAAALIGEVIEFGISLRAEIRRIGQRVSVAAVVRRDENVERSRRARPIREQRAVADNVVADATDSAAAGDQRLGQDVGRRRRPHRSVLVGNARGVHVRNHHARVDLLERDPRSVAQDDVDLSGERRRRLVHDRLIAVRGPPGVDDHLRGSGVGAADDPRTAGIVVRTGHRCRRSRVDRVCGEIDAAEHVGRLRIADRPRYRDSPLQQPIDQPVRLPHTEVLVSGVHRDDQRVRRERDGRRGGRSPEQRGRDRHDRQ